MTTFTAEAYQNEYLPAGGGEANAVVTVTASDAAPAVTSTQAAEVVIVDVSGSMGSPRAKLSAATRATAVAIDCIRDGVLFGVIAGNDTASAVYPQEGQLVPASAQTREDAKRAVARLRATGGTAIGSWLALAKELFAAAPEAIRHAILLTDGQDEHETPEQLEAVLADCEGSFQCDCRGVGTDWEVEELRHIAATLLGTVDIVAEPAGLQDDFQAMIERAMGKATGDVSLRLWTPQGATVAFLKQVAPTIEDLTSRANPVDALTADYPTGAWGDESRDYHLCIHVQPRAVGEEMLAGRVGLMVAGVAVSQALIRAIWTDDEQLSTRINREVAHYTGQAELADAIQEGLEARKSGDEHTATFKLGRAVQLAAAAGNSDTMKLLAGVVDVQDERTGTVRLKPRVQDADEMALDTRSTKTVRVKKLGS
jgi:von Willebrand factor type A C-terminal domain/von Willebrand factor type A domain